MRKPFFFAYAKTKTQISCSVTAQLIGAFVFATLIVQSLFYLNQNFQPLAIFCGCRARFVSDLVGNPEYRFFRVAVHKYIEHIQMFLLNIEEMERSEITLVKMIHYRQLHQDFLYFIYLFLQCNNTK